MRKLTVAEYITLDGVVEAPEQWQFAYMNEEVMGAIAAQGAETQTMLLGRTTFDVFAGTFANAPAGDPVAGLLNGLEKVVVASQEPTPWQNSRRLEGDVVEGVTALKEADGGPILTTGSITLARTLLAAGLVDELSLLVYPIVLGRGQRFFEDDGPRVPLELVSATPFTTGVIHQVYRRA
jgi:dihydrofolate reductase